jgi:hypothetical protein
MPTYQKLEIQFESRRGRENLLGSGWSVGKHYLCFKLLLLGLGYPSRTAMIRSLGSNAAIITYLYSCINLQEDVFD